MIKLTILIYKKEGTSHDQFVDFHRHRLGPLFMSLPVVQEHVRRYVQQHAVDSSGAGFPPSPADGIAELWFDDMAGLQAVFSSADYAEKIQPDEREFLELSKCEFVFSEEHVVH